MKFHSKTNFKYVQSNELIFSLILVVVFHTWFIKIQFWIKNWNIIQLKFRKKITFHNLHFALIFRQSFSLIWRTIILEYSLTGQRWMVCFTFFFPTVDDCQLLTVKHQLSTVEKHLFFLSFSTQKFIFIHALGSVMTFLNGFLAARRSWTTGSRFRTFLTLALALKKTSSGASIHEMTWRWPPWIRVRVATRPLGKTWTGPPAKKLISGHKTTLILILVLTNDVVKTFKIIFDNYVILGEVQFVWMTKTGTQKCSVPTSNHLMALKCSIWTYRI